MSTIDWGQIASYVATPVVGVITYWAGKKKRKNDFLKDLQASIDMLSQKNNELLKELLSVKEINVELAIQVQHLKHENVTLSEQVRALTEQLDNVRIITKIEKSHN